MNVCAIDLGFLYTKAIINNKPIIIKSVVGDAKTQRFDDLDFGLKDQGDRIKSRVGTEDYFVSDLAINQSDVIHHSLKGDRFNSSATEVLVRTVLGMGVGSDYVNSKVVSGLPVSHYDTYKDSIEELFLGRGQKTHNFDLEVNKKPIRGSVQLNDGKFIPQPFGALLDRILDDKGSIHDKELAGKTVAVIDPGFGTTDIYVANALSPVERLTFSTSTAMNHAYRLIANKIEDDFGSSLLLHEVEAIVRKGEFRSSGKVYNMKSIVDWAYKNTALQIVTEVTNKWNRSSREVDRILLAGGGGYALSRWILPEFNNIELLDDSQWAVVRGYHKWAIRNFL